MTFALVWICSRCKAFTIRQIMVNLDEAREWETDAPRCVGCSIGGGGMVANQFRRFDTLHSVIPLGRWT